MSLEIGSVCQHADARRAMLLVGPGYGDRIEISPDQTGGGAGLLDLGNELDWPGPGQGCAKVADRRGLSRLGFQLLQRHPPPRRDDLPALRGNDLVEYGCLHQPVVSRLLPHWLYYPGKEVGQAFQPDSESCQAGKPDLVRL